MGLVVIGIVMLAVMAFHIALYMLSKFIDSPRLGQMARDGAIDAAFTVVFGILALYLIQDQTFLKFPVPLLQFATGTNAAYSDVAAWYTNSYKSTIIKQSNILAAIDTQLTAISRNRGDVQYSFGGGSQNPFLALIQSIGLPTSKEASNDKKAADMILAAIPSVTLAFGGGGATAFYSTPLIMLRDQVAAIYAILTSMNVLFSIGTNTTLITALLFLGMLLRGFGFSKGGGSYLMAFGLTLHAVFPASMIFGLQIANNYVLTPPNNLLDPSLLQVVNNPSCNSIAGSFFSAYMAVTPPMFADDCANSVASTIFTSNLQYLSFAIAVYSLFLGFSLLLVITTSTGISKLLGAEVSIWIVGQLTRFV